MKYNTRSTRLKLSTTAISSSGVQEPLYALLSDESGYKVEVQTKDGKTLGDMTFKLEDDSLYVINMDNLSKSFKHVGNALHEFAFRYSEEMNKSGRVRFDAVRDSHYFHYKNGFKLENSDPEFFINYYLKLAKAVLENEGKRLHQDLGSYNLYLPMPAILEKRKQFGLLSSGSLETKMEAEVKSALHSSANLLVTEAEKNTLAIKTILGLDAKIGTQLKQKLLGDIPKLGIKKYLTKWSQLKTSHPGLFCEVTNNLLDVARDLLIQLLPLDSAEKQRRFDVIAAGALILAMAYQDHAHKEQAIYNNQRLYPPKTFNDLLQIAGCDEDTLVETTILCVGKCALIEQSVPFDGRIHADVFPELSSISELHKRLVSYQAFALKETTRVNEDLSKPQEQSTVANAQMKFELIPREVEADFLPNCALAHLVQSSLNMYLKFQPLLNIPKLLNRASRGDQSAVHKLLKKDFNLAFKEHSVTNLSAQFFKRISFREYILGMLEEPMLEIMISHIPNDEERAGVLAKLVSDYKISQLLYHVVRCNHDEVHALLEKDIDLLFQEGIVIDCSGRFFRRISALKYAFWALDEPMWNTLLSCVQKSGKSQEVLPKLFTLYNAFHPEENTADAVQNKGVTYEFQGRIISELHYDFALIQALQEQSEIEIASEDMEIDIACCAMDKQWRLGIGKAQRLLPMHIVKEYCSARAFQPDSDFATNPGSSRQFYNSMTHEYEDWFCVGSALGFDFAIHKMSTGGCCATADAPCNSVIVRDDLAAIMALREARIEAFTNFKKELDQSMMLENQSLSFQM